MTARRRCRPNTTEGGFTLLALLVVLVFLGLIGALRAGGDAPDAAVGA